MSKEQEIKKKNRQFEIGQIVYVLSETNQRIIPGMICEEVIVKTIEGKHISWKLSLGPKNKEKVIDVNDIKGEIYTSISDIKTMMETNFKKYINSLISESLKLQKEWYNVTEKVTEKEKIEDEFFEIPKNSFKDQKTNQLDTIREELKQKLLPSEEELQANIGEVDV